MAVKVQQLFHLTFGAPIWSMTLSDDARLLLISIRDEHAHEVTYQALDLQRGGLLWEGLSFEESWWTSLHACHNEVLVFSAQHDQQNPDNKSYFGLQLHTQELCWQLDDFHLHEVGNRGLSGWYLQDEPGTLRYFDLATGEESKPKTLSLAADQQDHTKEVQFPLHYTEESGHFDTFKRYLRHSIQAEPKGAIDYLELPRVVIMSGYVAMAKKLENFLLMLSAEGETLLYDTLGKELTGLAADTFFVCQGQLLYIKNKNELIGYAIPE